MSAMAQRAREALGLEGGNHQQQQHYLKYRQQHVHEYPSEYSLGEYSVGEQKFRDSRAEVQRIRARTTECQKVHKLTARTGAQVSSFHLFSPKKINSCSVGGLHDRRGGGWADRLCHTCHCEEGREV